MTEATTEIVLPMHIVERERALRKQMLELIQDDNEDEPGCFTFQLSHWTAQDVKSIGNTLTFLSEWLRLVQSEIATGEAFAQHHRVFTNLNPVCRKKVHPDCVTVTSGAKYSNCWRRS
eukprot:TRINITY_DN18651_c0_g1_i1.p1 TRINITY_DN18651_c0_g1~~TRINITY_DN18651_c0_g1_i1.p1  ORF type:complete len:130 (-),score=3.87 TRINITY_DN18651_c0_g1_i1:417-770(-)